MATIAQRLVAAGASPERAAAFEKQFTAARPGLKKQDIEDAFDAEIAAASAALYPKSFRPPTTDDPAVDDYIIGVYGQQRYDALTKGAFAKLAPDFVKAKNSANPFSKDLTSAIEQGTSLADLIGDIREAALNNPAALGNLTEEDAIKVTSNLYNEYTAAQGKANEAKIKFLEGDKYYKAGLPHPNLRYGTSTNLKAGTVDIRTLPKVDEYFAEQNRIAREQFPGSSAAAGIVLESAIKTINQRNQTPFKDEVKRRQFIKDKNLK